MKYGNAKLHVHDYYSYAHVEAGGEDDERVEIQLGGFVVAVGTSADLGGSLLQSHTRASHSGSLHHGKSSQLRLIFSAFTTNPKGQIYM